MLLFRQKSEEISLFRFFLWLFFLGFVTIYPGVESFAAEKLYDARGARDPFVPLVGANSKAVAGGLLGVESLEGIVIEGIVCDAVAKNSIVVVNGSILKEGDEDGNVKVLRIDPKGALFSVNGVEGYRALYEETETAAGEKKN